MNDQIYKEIILEHWENPQNYGILKNADVDLTGSNPLCGDNIRITINLINGKISDIAFISEGCAISKASASLFTSEIRGKKIDEIIQTKPQFVLDILEVPLSPTRTKCALLVYSTIIEGFK